MLHVDRLSGQRSEPHPYMMHIYQLLDPQEAADPSGSDGTLVQSFRTSQFGPPGWIWFNVSHLMPSMSAAELVLLRRTLHPEPLSVSVAIHAGPALDGRPLGLAGGAAGFRLRYADESGNLELHEALTQSLYCLNTSAQSQPLLVAYRLGRPRQVARPTAPSSQCRQQHHRCGSALRRQSAPPAPSCRLHKHYVDFQDLSDWVLQPLGFSFSFCRWVPSSFCYFLSGLSDHLTGFESLGTTTYTIAATEVQGYDIAIGRLGNRSAACAGAQRPRHMGLQHPSWAQMHSSSNGKKFPYAKHSKTDGKKNMPKQ
uniref:Uncharacterized protein n=1 Tax=Paramormyrops kingsleyae TaxID=1676925 RepID=A0A3B3QJX1_9TELE